jgi:hypothetical protein
MKLTSKEIEKLLSEMFTVTKASAFVVCVENLIDTKVREALSSALYAEDTKEFIRELLKNHFKETE